MLRLGRPRRRRGRRDAGVTAADSCLRRDRPSAAVAGVAGRAASADAAPPAPAPAPASAPARGFPTQVGDAVARSRACGAGPARTPRASGASPARLRGRHGQLLPLNVVYGKWLQRQGRVSESRRREAGTCRPPAAARFFEGGIPKGCF